MHRLKPPWSILLQIIKIVVPVYSVKGVISYMFVCVFVSLLLLTPIVWLACIGRQYFWNAIGIVLSKLVLVPVET